MKLKIIIDATKENDSDSIKSDVTVDADCDGRMAVSVLVKFFESHEEVKELVEGALAYMNLSNYKKLEEPEDTV